jgi:hypothetical protein
MTELLKAIIALPDIFRMLRDFGKFMKDTFGDNWSKFLADSSVAFKDLSEAKTPDQKREAARKIQDLIGRLG